MYELYLFLYLISGQDRSTEIGTKIYKDVETKKNDVSSLCFNGNNKESIKSQGQSDLDEIKEEISNQLAELNSRIEKEQWPKHDWAMKKVKWYYNASKILIEKDLQTLSRINSFLKKVIGSLDSVLSPSCLPHLLERNMKIIFIQYDEELIKICENRHNDTEKCN